MKKYLIRLDDASDYMDIEKWAEMERILDSYSIKPIVGVIPENRDISIINKYQRDLSFWEKVRTWKEKGWEIAMHGCYHEYVTKEGGYNKRGNKSEFAGLGYEIQKEKIRTGFNIMKLHGLEASVFFAPSHSFDDNTLEALRNETPIRVISDTIATNTYKSNGFWFIPQQSGRVRTLPFPLVTFCYHPNTCDNQLFSELEEFIKNNRKYFVEYSADLLKDRKKNIIDRILESVFN